PSAALLIGRRRPTAAPTSGAPYHFGSARASRPLIPLFVIVASRVADAERLQLAVQRRALHADERRGARDVTREAADLDLEIFALERLARLAERRPHD